MVVVIWDDLISHPYFIVHLFFVRRVTLYNSIIIVKASDNSFF